MKDEIKEILDILIFNKKNILNRVCSVEDFVSREQIIKLLDYITNLQEENERQEKLISRLYSVISDDEENFKLLQEENDYLKDIVSNTELSNEIKKADKWTKRELYKINYQRLQVNKRLRDENEELKDTIDFIDNKYNHTIDYNEKLIEYNQNYKSRIDKAIEIYEKEDTIKYKKERFYKDKPTKTLMYEALQGSDNNDN